MRALENVAALLRLDKITTADILDIALVALVIYLVFDAVRGTRAAQMLVGLLLCLGVYEITKLLGMRTLHTVLAYSLQYAPFAIIVLFQAEFRRGLTAIGKNNPLVRLFYAAAPVEDVLAEVVYAAATLSSQRTGALIVLERSQRLKNYVEGGIKLDATVSYDLLVSIFHTATPLHDGAVIVSEGRIAAAACFLPLTLQPSLSKTYGSRHRAAVGIAEETDAVAVVVSEETGKVSIAVEGRVHADLRSDALEPFLRSLFPSAARSARDHGTAHA